MKFTTKTRYGIRTMLEIASNQTENAILQKDIAVKQDISVKYLDQIISSLKAAGLINNLKGKKSGYVLSRPASDITIFDIHNAFENGICVIDCVKLSIECDKSSKCKSQLFWRGLNNVVVAYFKQTTLHDLLKIDGPH